MACSGCYIKVIKRDTNTVLSKKAHRLPASDVLMNSDDSAHSQEIFTHTKYTFDQKKFLKTTKILTRETLPHNSAFCFVFLKKIFPFFSNLWVMDIQ